MMIKLTSISALIKKDILSFKALCKGLKQCDPEVQEMNWSTFGPVPNLSRSLLLSAVKNEDVFSCLQLVKGLQHSNSVMKAMCIEAVMGTASCAAQQQLDALDEILKFVISWFKTAKKMPPFNLSKGKN